MGPLALTMTVVSLTAVVMMMVTVVVREAICGRSLVVLRGDRLGRGQDETAGLDSLGADQVFRQVPDLARGPAKLPGLDLPGRASLAGSTRRDQFAKRLRPELSHRFAYRGHSR